MIGARATMTNASHAQPGERTSPGGSTSSVYRVAVTPAAPMSGTVTSDHAMRRRRATFRGANGSPRRAEPTIAWRFTTTIQETASRASATADTAIRVSVSSRSTRALRTTLGAVLMYRASSPISKFVRAIVPASLTSISRPASSRSWSANGGSSRTGSAIGPRSVRKRPTRRRLASDARTRAAISSRRTTSNKRMPVPGRSAVSQNARRQASPEVVPSNAG